MKSIQVNIYIVALVLISMVLSTSCRFDVPELVNVRQTSKERQSQTDDKTKALVAQIRNKESYQGPIKITLDSNWFNHPSADNKVDLTSEFPENSFEIKSLNSNEEIVYSREFGQDNGLTELVDNFEIKDTSSRYTLSVESLNKKSKNSRIKVNLTFPAYGSN